ncbi:MAG: hypothetical protein AB1465_06975 [Patescibacteria group bacterium]
MSIEREMRFYFSLKELESWKTVLKQLNYKGRYYEITIMYDNPNPKYTFYTASVDGRLRLRAATPTDKNATDGYGFVSWKQRIPSLKNELIKHENEIEFNFHPAELSAVQTIIEDVLHCPRISSYERYRNHYENGDIHITLDEFPFGLVLELEVKKNSEDIEQQLTKILLQLNLNSNNASHLSCDDMYRELCLKENKNPKSDILFNDPDMPRY